VRRAFGWVVLVAAFVLLAVLVVLWAVEARTGNPAALG